MRRKLILGLAVAVTSLATTLGVAVGSAGAASCTVSVGTPRWLGTDVLTSDVTYGSCFGINQAQNDFTMYLWGANGQPYVNVLGTRWDNPWPNDVIRTYPIYSGNQTFDHGVACDSDYGADYIVANQNNGGGLPWPPFLYGNEYTDINYRLHNALTNTWGPWHNTESANNNGGAQCW